MRVQVSFGPRVRVGMIVALARESDQEPDRLKPILALLDPQPVSYTHLTLPTSDLV